MRGNRKGILNITLQNILAVMIIVFLVAPFLWVFSASLQGENELLKKPPNFIPKKMTFDNYRYVFTGKIPTSYEVKGQLRSRISQEARLIAPALKNSFSISIWVMVVNLVLGVLAAYTFARRKFKGGTASFNFILGSRLMPVMAIAIPYYVIIQNLHLLDTQLSLILVNTALTLPLTIWFLTLYIANVPLEIEESSRVDGCSSFQSLVRIVMPLTVPALITAAAFAFMTSYNEFVFARFLTQTIQSQTGPVIIASISGNPDVSYSLISVCVTLAMIPPLILAVVMRKWLTEGLSSTVTIR